MKTRTFLFLSLAFTTGLPALGFALQNTPTAAPLPAPDTPSLVTRVEQPAALPIKTTTGLLGQVQQMVEGGSDNEVIKAFVQNWSGRYSVTADDILHLHRVGAANDVLTTLIRRSAELQAQSAAIAASTTAPTNPPPAAYPQMTAPPAYEYPYASDYPYPAYTYPTYNYPAYAYSYAYSYPSVPYWSSWWGWPYSYSLYYNYGWPSYRSHSWAHQPWRGYGHPGYTHARQSPGYSHGWQSPGYSRPWQTPGYSHGGQRPGFSGHTAYRANWGSAGQHFGGGARVSHGSFPTAGAVRGHGRR